MISQDWDAITHRREETVSQKDRMVEEKGWVGWQQLLTKEPAEVLVVMLDTGKLLARPHSKLDHDHDKTKALPEQFQKEHFWVQATDTIIDEHKKTNTKANDLVDEEGQEEDREAAKKEQDNVLEMKKAKDTTISLVKRSLAKWSSMETDISTKMEGFAQVEYFCAEN